MADGAQVGARSDCTSYQASGCVPIQWPGERTTARHELDPQGEIRNWFGSLVDDIRDASGQMYRRNRYYDPQTGQFTQPDPIGIAGGLNEYGFAEGDPVSYSDPYGLCPEKGSSKECPLVLPEVTVTASRYTRMEIDETSILIGGGIVGKGAAAARPLLARLGGGLRQLLGRRVLSNPDRALLREFFGRGMRGVRDRAADFRIPEGLGREALTKYRQLAMEAIENGIDKSGVQSERIKLIDRALDELP